MIGTAGLAGRLSVDRSPRPRPGELSAVSGGIDGDPAMAVDRCPAWLSHRDPKQDGGQGFRPVPAPTSRGGRVTPPTLNASRHGRDNRSNASWARRRKEGATRVDS